LHPTISVFWSFDLNYADSITGIHLVLLHFGEALEEMQRQIILAAENAFPLVRFPADKRCGLEIFPRIMKMGLGI
jgi:hypothetical protein